MSTHEQTLVDMTAEERANCVGMWCDNLVSTADNPQPVVLACVQGERCWILHTDLHGEWSCFSLDRVAPRFDLPRAWTPDGEPELAQALAEEEWQYGVTYTGVKHGGHHIEWVEPTDDAEWDKETLQLLIKRWKKKGQSPKIVRRRVSPPEVING